jgi:hypothetical protein
LAYKNGGLILNEVYPGAYSAAVKNVLKSVGNKILAGSFKDVMRVSKPATITYPLSF